MQVYRISKTKFAKDMKGLGAEMYGGRWNHIGTACLYTASTRALALLEYSVNVNLDVIPKALSIVTFEIDEKKVKEILLKDLPDNWKEKPVPVDTQDLGTKLLKEGIPIIKLPSTVVEEEYNYIINPLIKATVNIIDVHDFVYDIRIKE